MRTNRNQSRFLVLGLVMLAVAPVLRAQFTSGSGFTKTPDTVGIGIDSNPGAKLHVLSSSNNSVMALYGPTNSTNGSPFGVVFSDTMPAWGVCCGLVEELGGNSLLKVSNLQLGYFGTPLIEALAGSPLYLNAASGIAGFPSAGDVIVGYNGIGNGLRVNGSGNSSFYGAVGFGLTAPLDRVHVLGSSPAVRVEENGFAGSVSLLGNNVAVGPYLASHTSSSGAATTGTTAHRIRFGSGLMTVDEAPVVAVGTQRTWTTRFQINDGGTVVIGNPQSISATEVLNVAGNINVSGNINAKYQDLAEWVPAAGPMIPGTVVVLNPGKSNEVMASSSAYDTAVAGVVSANPGVILGEAAPSKARIATTGRVKVRVDASRPVRIGDLLVTSDKPGVAMRSEPMEINGRKFHQPGTVIGKALEPLAGGEGEILVLLSLQ